MEKKCSIFNSFKKPTNIATTIYINVCVCVCVHSWRWKGNLYWRTRAIPLNHLGSILRSTVKLSISQHILWDPLEPFLSNTDVGVFQSPLRIFHNLKDVGFLQVKVIRAEGLMVADVTGKKWCNSPIAYIYQAACEI